MFDENGLYFEIAPSGGKWWRLKYHSPVTRKEKRLSLGTYPDISLGDAREKRDERCFQGRSPWRSGAGAYIFESVMREWYCKFSPEWAESHSTRLLRMFERDVFPEIGRLPVADMTPLPLLAVAQKVEERSPDTAHRPIRRCGQVFSYAVLTMRCTADPTAPLVVRAKDGC